MNSTQNDKTIFEIFLQLFVKDILVDIRNDTIVYIKGKDTFNMPQMPNVVKEKKWNNKKKE